MKKKIGIGEKISDAFGVPKTVIMDMPSITMQGNREMQVENYKGILKYTANEIAFLAKDFSVCIFGKELKIDEMNVDMLLISGFFEKIEYKI